MRSLAFVAVVLLALTPSCSNQKKKAREAFMAAKAEQAAALAALRQADTSTAVNHFHDSVTRIEKLRRSTAPPMSEDPGEGPVVDGLTAKAGQELWEREFKSEIETQLPALLAATKAGTLDWSTGRALLTAYRPDLDPDWVAGVKAAAQGEVAQRADAYHLRCASSFEDVCARVRPVLERKFARALDDKRLLELATERQMFGSVVVEGSFDGYRQYASIKDPQKNEIFALPARLDVKVTVQTFRGSSSWDGVISLHAELEPPEFVSSDSLREKETAHYEALYQRALEPLGARPAQTLQ